MQCVVHGTARERVFAIKPVPKEPAARPQHGGRCEYEERQRAEDVRRPATHVHVREKTKGTQPHHLPVTERIYFTSSSRYGLPSTRKMSWNQTGGSDAYGFCQESHG